MASARRLYRLGLALGGLGAAALAADGATVKLPLLLTQSCMAAMVILPVGALLAARPLLSSP